MSSFQNENSDLEVLDILMKLYYREFIYKPNEETQRVNPTGSEDTARRDESDSKILKFEEQTRKRAKKVLLHEINRILTRLENKRKI